MAGAARDEAEGADGAAGVPPVAAAGRLEPLDAMEVQELAMDEAVAALAKARGLPNGL